MIDEQVLPLEEVQGETDGRRTTPTENVKKTPEDDEKKEHELTIEMVTPQVRVRLDKYATLYYPEELAENTKAQQQADREYTQRVAAERGAIAEQRFQTREQLEKAREQIASNAEHQRKRTDDRDAAMHKRDLFIQSRIDTVSPDERIDPVQYEKQENQRAEKILSQLHQEALSRFFEQEDIQALQAEKHDPYRLFATLETKYTALQSTGITLSQEDWSILCNYFVRTDLQKSVTLLDESIASMQQNTEYLTGKIARHESILADLEQKLSELSTSSPLRSETIVFYQKVYKEYMQDMEVATVASVAEQYGSYFVHSMRYDPDKPEDFLQMVKRKRTGETYCMSTIQQGHSSRNVYKPLAFLITSGQVQDAFNRDVHSEMNNHAEVSSRVTAYASTRVEGGTGRLCDQVVAAEAERLGEGGGQEYNEYFVGSRDFLGDEHDPVTIGGVLMFIDEYADPEVNNVHNMNAKPGELVKIMREVQSNNVPLYVWRNGKMYMGEYNESNNKLTSTGESIEPTDILNKKVEIPQK